MRRKAAYLASCFYFLVLFSFHRGVLERKFSAEWDKRAKVSQNSEITARPGYLCPCSRTRDKKIKSRNVLQDTGRKKNKCTKIAGLSALKRLLCLKNCDTEPALVPGKQENKKLGSRYAFVKYQTAKKIFHQAMIVFKSCYQNLISTS